MLPDEPNEEERQEQLPEDGATPFSPADPPQDDSAASDDDQPMAEDLDSTHPLTDTDLQPEDIYENGVAGAAGATEPNAGDAVVGYHGVPNPGVNDDANISAPNENAEEE